MSLYEIGILGSISASERQTLSDAIRMMVDDFGLAVGSEVTLHDGTTVGKRDKRAAFAACYFGAAKQKDVAAAQEVAGTSAPIIPIIGPTGDFRTQIPLVLQASNGLRLRADDPGMTTLAVALLECVGLLRRQRRLFVSYRRTESRNAALQIHDTMSGRGFDVFLDTHDIRPGDPFQDVLWHRLCDADVVVMLDTPTYFESKWTRQEFGRARAKEIQILRVVWPDHTPTRLTDMAETVYLRSEDLEGPGGPIVATTVDTIVLAVEKLRSRSIASRHMSMSGRLRVEAERVGAKVEGIGAHRALSLRLVDDRRLWAYPIVGVPTAETFYDVSQKALKATQQEMPVLVYDHMGLGETWGAHLKWLDENIKTVRAIKISDAGWQLAAWEA